uniref:G domain-containing protein n=1 Tax=Paulinella micropora TaxID=1928728 RepID=A0A385HZY7_9EUKA|nr:hypothetical protein PMNZ_245 [Paulinella micropora]AXY63198.1 hypothetical protein PMNZ_245 [Paulinella micropora]
MNNKQVWVLFSFCLLFFTSCVQSINRITWYLQEFLPGWVLIALLLLILYVVVNGIFGIGCRDIQTRVVRGMNYLHRKSIIASYTAKATAIHKLKIIDNNLHQLQDKKQAESLLQEKIRLEGELKRRDLVTVVFGTGSSGKTSLIRALIGKTIGIVNASMGSTDNCSQYRIHLTKSERGLILIDTPGILESGYQGHIREIKARWEASRADLILIVVDGDLRSQEEDILQSLIALGKRLILVLNKCDLLGEHEEEYLVRELRSKCRKLISPLDIVSASSVSEVPSISASGVSYLQPEIERLTNRMTDILLKDGEELIISNISMQCEYLYEASRWLLNQQRQIDAQKVIEHYMWISVGVIVVSEIPSLELISMAAVNTRMVVEIARLYGVTLDFAIAKALVSSMGHALVSLGILKSGMSLIRSALSLNTPILIISKAVQVVTLAWLTRLIGLSFITYFEQKQEWGEEGIDGVIQYYFDLNKRDRLLKHFLEVSYNRVVEPLRMAQRK